MLDARQILGTEKVFPRDGSAALWLVLSLYDGGDRLRYGKIESPRERPNVGRFVVTKVFVSNEMDVVCVLQGNRSGGHAGTNVGRV